MNKNHHVYFDNFFSFTTLLEHLEANKTGSVHFTDPQSIDYHEWTTQMEYLNGRLNGLPKWTPLNYLL